MELRDPVSAYNAATNVEAHLVKMLLMDAGVDAFVTEDLSTGGLWMFGTLPEIHKPQVWISASDSDRAHLVLQEYGSRAAERVHVSQQKEAVPGPTIEVLCDECNEKSHFPSAQGGTIQDCPKCGAYVDVGEVDEVDPYWLENDEAEDGDEA